jgi:hypothetical protein
LTRLRDTTLLAQAYLRHKLAGALTERLDARQESEIARLSRTGLP